MKKKIAILFMTVIMAMTLVACGKFTCDFCGEEKSGKSYKSDVWGQEVVICEECYDGIQDLFGGK